MRTAAIFDRSEGIECASTRLRERGLESEALSIVVHDTAERGETRPEETLHRGAARNALRGGAIGAALGLVLGLATIAIPGIGPVIAAGPLAAALSGLSAAASGATVGGIVGALVGALARLGVPEDAARAYASAIERGHAVVTVEHDGSVDVAAVLRACGAREIRTV